jgi:hypothetical protein
LCLIGTKISNPIQIKPEEQGPTFDVNR